MGKEREREKGKRVIIFNTILKGERMSCCAMDMDMHSKYSFTRVLSLKLDYTRKYNNKTKVKEQENWLKKFVCVYEFACVLVCTRASVCLLDDSLFGLFPKCVKHDGCVCMCVLKLNNEKSNKLNAVFSV